MLVRMLLSLNYLARLGGAQSRAVGVLSVVLVTGCGPKSGDDLPEEVTAGGSETGSTTEMVTTSEDTDEIGDTDDDPTNTGGEVSCDGQPSNKNIDVLFMIDDSGSMAEKQLALAANLDAFIEVLEKADMSYRIAFTTSDNGNPLCPTHVKAPEGGRFVLSSCRERLDHFVFPTIPPVDATDAACLDICPHESIAITPTTTNHDSTSMARPWIERIDGETNLPAGMSVVEALRCFAPMGVAGCGYEEQLESVYKALRRAEDPTQQEYGFLRDDATLAIVLVTDEADGSYNRAPYGNFGPYDPDGNKVFWSDSSANFPTSAVSWNAGVECLGSGSPYTDCQPQHHDIDGNVISAAQAPTSAVLHPVSRYTSLLDAYAATGKRVVVLGMLGVPPGYESGTPLVYRDAPEHPDFMLSFGIGPGCESPLSLPGMEPYEAFAVPPVRQREFVESFPGKIYSICEADYGNRLAHIACDLIDPAG
jgi:hypothetical protein